MRFLDASVPLCVMTGEPKKHYRRCIEIMGEIERGKEKAATGVFTVAEIGHILQKRERFGREKVRSMVRSLMDCQGLKLLDVEAILCREAVDLSAAFGIDFVDSYNVLTMGRKNIKQIYSLDEHYDMFEEIERII